MWYEEKYRIVTENPYNKEKLNGLGLVIYSEWKDSFVNIIQQNEIKHLFLGMEMFRLYFFTIYKADRNIRNNRYSFCWN